MSTLYLDGREVVDAEVSGKGVDAYIESAAWADTGGPLTDEELERLQDDNGDWLVMHQCKKYGYYAK